MIAGTLTVEMAANMARFAEDMRQVKGTVNSTMQGVESAVAGAKAALGALGLSLGAIGFVHMIKSAIEAQDALSKLSQKVGVGVEALAGYQHAAQLAGVSNEALTKGFKTLSSQMFDASMGLLESKRNFSLLGIEVKNADGTLRSADSVMIDVADRFAGMQDGAAKSALAVKLFGKAGLDMIPMLNMGSGALADMVAEGKKLNPVTAESAKQAELFNDSMLKLEKSVSAVGVNIVNDLLGPLSRVASDFAEAALSADGFWRSAAGWALSTNAEVDDPAAAMDKVSAALVKQRELLATHRKSWMSWYFADDISALMAGIAINEAKLAYLGNAKRARGIVDMVGDTGMPTKRLTSLAPGDDAANAKAIAAAKKYAEQEKKAQEEAIKYQYDQAQEFAGAMTKLKRDQFAEDEKLRALGLKGDEEAAQAKADIAKGEMNAINDARNAAFAEQKKQNEQSLHAWESLWSEVERTGKDVFVHIFSDGKNAFEGIGRAIKASVIDLLYQLTAKRWIIQLGATVGGALGIPGAASAAASGGGIGDLFSTATSANTVSGWFGGPSLSAGSLFGGGGTMLSGSAGLAGVAGTGAAEELASLGVAQVGGSGALGALGTAMPYIGAALLAAQVLGVFDGGGPKQQDLYFANDPGNQRFGADNITSQSGAFYNKVNAYSAALRADYTPEQLNRLSGISVSAPAGSDENQLFAQLQQAVTSALAGVKSISQTKAELDAWNASIDVTRQALLSAQDPLGYWNKQIATLQATLGTSAGSIEDWRKQFLAALDASPTQEQFDAWKSLGTALEQAANAAGAAAGTLAALTSVGFSTLVDYTRYQRLVANGIPVDARGVALPQFASGTDFVPYDMVAQIHHGERIVPASENRGGDGGMVEEIRELREDLRAGHAAIARNTGEIARLARRWDRDGLGVRGVDPTLPLEVNVV